MTVEQAIEAARWKWQPYSPTEAALVSLADEVERLQEELKQSKNEAKSLAAWVWKHHYRESAPGWVLRDSVAGVISQIANMAAGLSEENRTLTVEVERLRESKESDRDRVEQRDRANEAEAEVERLQVRLADCIDQCEYHAMEADQLRDLLDERCP